MQIKSQITLISFHFLSTAQQGSPVYLSFEAKIAINCPCQDQKSLAPSYIKFFSFELLKKKEIDILKILQKIKHTSALS